MDNASIISFKLGLLLAESLSPAYDALRAIDMGNCQLDDETRNELRVAINRIDDAMVAIVGLYDSEDSEL